MNFLHGGIEIPLIPLLIGLFLRWLVLGLGFEYDRTRLGYVMTVKVKKNTTRINANNLQKSKRLPA